LVEKHRLNFEILHDQGNAFAEKLDLVHGFEPELKEIYLGLGADLAQVNGEPSWTLPVPARIAVGRDHSILSIQFDADYQRRPEPEEVLRDFA
jgi:peroxiredoxin